MSSVEQTELDGISEELKIRFFDGPKLVGLRDVTQEERQRVMFEALNGGRDYGERPSFWAPYDGLSAYQSAKSMQRFFEKSDNRHVQTSAAFKSFSQDMTSLKYLPIIGRRDWILVLNNKGETVTYLPGDGF